jgi:hypothetical protein
MNAFLKSVGTGSGSFFYVVGCMAILGVASELWPSRYIWYVVGAVLALWYVWRFLIQPFRSGLKKEDHD